MSTLKIVISIAVFVSSVMSGSGQSATGPTSTHDPNRPEAIPIVIRLEGFERQTIPLPTGRYVLSILNRSGLKGLETVLERMPGNSITATPSQQVFDAAVDPVKARSLQSVQLTPGTYRLREVHHNHPLWVIAIQVQ